MHSSPTCHPIVIQGYGNGGNGGRLVNIRLNNVLIYIVVTWHRIK